MQPRTKKSSQPCQPEHALNTQPRTESSSQPCQPEHALIMQPRMESSSQPCLVHALIMQPSTESSSQPQLERAPPTGDKTCATIVPESLSTRDNVIQTIKIKTSTGSADVTKQSASSADSTKTPANSATTEMQKYSYEYEAQLILQEAHLKLQEGINGNLVVCARDSEFKVSLASTVPLPGEYCIRPSRKAIRLAKKARKLFRHSHLEGGDGSDAPLNYLAWCLMDEEHAAANKSLWQSFSEFLARGRPYLHAAEYSHLLQNRMTVEKQRHHLEQIQNDKEQREHTDRVR